MLLSKLIFEAVTTKSSCRIATLLSSFHDGVSSDELFLVWALLLWTDVAKYQQMFG